MPSLVLLSEENSRNTKWSLSDLHIIESHDDKVSGTVFNLDQNEK